MDDKLDRIIRELLAKANAGEGAAGIKVGYARVSTEDQKLDMQIDALTRDGVEEHHIHTDKASGVKRDRPGLRRALMMCRRGDTLVVWRLDRIARSLVHLLEVMADLERRGIGFRSVTEAIDTGTPAGRLIMHVIGAIAEFERQLIAERTRAGVRAHRERGGKHGAPLTLDLKLIAERIRKGHSVVQIARDLKVTHQAIRYHFTGTEIRALRDAGKKVNRPRKRR